MTKPDESAPPEPLLDLQRLMVAIRRGRRFWLSLGVLGFLAGALLAVLAPPAPTAVTRLLIVHEADQPSDSGSLMKTDVALLQTARIAAVALQNLGSTERPDEFLASYKATGLTNNVLELTVQGSSESDAVARAKAVADAFIADHVARAQAAADAQAKALTDQRDRVQAELDKVKVDLRATPPRPTGDDATRRDALIASEDELNGQVSELQRRADEAKIGTPRVAAGTQIVDGPRVVSGSAVMAGVLNAVIGFLLGLTAGIALAAVASVVKDRPVLRREIAAHLGASVIAQLRTLPRFGPARLWRRSRSVAERGRVAATLVRLVPDGPAAVSLLELGCPRTAAALAMDMADNLATDFPVVVVDNLPGRDILKLRRNRAGNGTGGDDDGPIRVTDGSDGPLPKWPGERHIGVGSVAPGTAWTDLTNLGSETVLLVRAGHANTAWLHTVARQLADCGIPVIGVVLVDPDRRDRSDGTLWDGLHTALRGRAGRGVDRTAAPSALRREARAPVDSPPAVEPPNSLDAPTAPHPSSLDAPTAPHPRSAAW